MAYLLSLYFSVYLKAYFYVKRFSGIFKILISYTSILPNNLSVGLISIDIQRDFAPN